MYVRSCMRPRAVQHGWYILLYFCRHTSVCLTFNKIRRTRIHKHRWAATNRRWSPSSRLLVFTFRRVNAISPRYIGLDKFFLQPLWRWTRPEISNASERGDIIFCFSTGEVCPSHVAVISKMRGLRGFALPDNVRGCKLFPRIHTAS